MRLQDEWATHVLHISRGGAATLYPIQDLPDIQVRVRNLLEQCIQLILCLDLGPRLDRGREQR